MIKANRLKAMETHYRQLEPKYKADVDRLIEKLDDEIEDILLKQFYTQSANFIREYRKHYSLTDIKKQEYLNRIPIINSRVDGVIPETRNKKDRDLDLKIKNAVYEQRQKEQNIKDIIMTGSK